MLIVLNIMYFFLFTNLNGFFSKFEFAPYYTCDEVKPLMECKHRFKANRDGTRCNYNPL